MAHRPSLGGNPQPEVPASDTASEISEKIDLTSTKRRTHKVKPSHPMGVLAVHVKCMRLEKWSMDQLYDSPTISVYLRMRAGETVKYTCAYDNVGFPATLYFDDLKHFSLRVRTNRGHPGNIFKVDLMGFDRPDLHLIIGRIELHIFDIIKKMYTVETFRMKRMDKVIGELDLEFCFSYGLFGYGYSHQLENRQMSPRDQISHSMFTRVAPPLGRNSVNVPDVMTPIPIEHPIFIPFTVKSTIGRETDDSNQEQSLEEDPIMLLSKMRKRFHNLQTVFNKKTSRKARIMFLEKLILKNDIDDASEEFKVPPSFRLKHRKAPQQSEMRRMRKAGGLLKEFYEEEEDDLDLDDADLTEAQKMISLAPGVRMRSMSLSGRRESLKSNRLPERSTPSPGLETIKSTVCTFEPPETDASLSPPPPPPINEQPKSLFSRFKRFFMAEKTTLGDVAEQAIELQSQAQDNDSAKGTVSEFGLAGSIDPGFAHSETYRPLQPQQEEAQVRRSSITERLQMMLGGARRNPVVEEPAAPAVPRVMLTPSSPVGSESESSDDEISDEEEETSLRRQSTLGDIQEKEESYITLGDIQEQEESYVTLGDIQEQEESYITLGDIKEQEESYSTLGDIQEQEESYVTLADIEEQEESYSTLGDIQEQEESYITLESL